jgi:hypothetical protein
MKGLCLTGPPRSGGISRPDLRDLVASWVECGPHGGKKRKTKSWTRVGAGQESACGVCGGSPEIHQVTWLRHKTKTIDSAGGDGIWAR